MKNKSLIAVFIILLAGIVSAISSNNYQSGVDVSFGGEALIQIIMR